MDGWDLVLLVVAGYVAVMTLVRLMRRHRDALMTDVRKQIEAEQRRRRAERKKTQRGKRNRAA